MTNVFLYDDFKLFLKDELERRVFRNPKYSLRAFARDIGLSISRLSEIISNQEGIRLSTAAKIASTLKMSHSEKEYFQYLIISKHGRSGELRDKAFKKVQTFKSKRHFRRLPERYKDLLSTWYCLPLIELLTSKEPSSLFQISEILEASEREITATIAHLEELGHIKKIKVGRWKKSIPFIKIDSLTPSNSIQGYHKKLLQKAEGALKQPIQKRKYLSAVFGIKKESLEEARNELEAFSQNFLEKFTSEDAADMVYCFGVQLYQLESVGKR